MAQHATRENTNLKVRSQRKYLEIIRYHAEQAVVIIRHYAE